MKRVLVVMLLLGYGAVALLGQGLHALPGVAHHHHSHAHNGQPHSHSHGHAHDHGHADHHDVPAPGHHHSPDDDCFVCQFLAQAAAAPELPAAIDGGMVVAEVPSEQVSAPSGFISLLPPSRGPPAA